MSTDDAFNLSAAQVEICVYKKICARAQRCELPQSKEAADSNKINNLFISRFNPIQSD